MEQAFFISPSDEEKWTHLNLNVHLKSSITANLVMDQLWFSDYLFEDNHGDSANIVVHLKAYQRREVCNPEDFVESAKAKQNLSFDRPTHVISEVLYGFNIVFVFKLSVSSVDEKTYFANKMFLQAKKMFKCFNSTAENHLSDVPDLLQKASFRFFTDLKWNGLPKDGNFFASLKSIWSLLHVNDRASFVPIEVGLCSLLSISSRAPLSRDMDPDMVTKLFSLKHNLQQVLTNCKALIQDRFLTRFPSSASPVPRLEEFHKCLVAIDEDISCTISSNLVAYRRYGIGIEDILDVSKDVYNDFFLDDFLMEWLVTRHNEILSLKFLLQDIDIPWNARELEIDDIEPGQHLESFVFHIKLDEDPLLRKLKQRLSLDDGDEEWATFDVLTVSGQEQEVFRSKLQAFCKQAFESQCEACFITSESLPDGTVKSLSRPYAAKLSFSDANSFTDEEEFLSSMLASSALSTNPVTQPNMKSINEMPALAPADPIESFYSPEPSDDESVEERILGTYECIYQKKSPCVAKDFIAYSQLIQEGDPAIYLLKADEKTSCFKKLRWFNIGKPGGSAVKSHKVVILMGATGAGKSTLINGMANYILGVEWSDAFRFRLVSDVAQSKHLSQTSSVTAYTIYHKDGMKIPFDFTIIDTPGYGDARGVEHDQEVTRLIGKFMGHLETEYHLDHINALCFVGRASDLQLTPSQKYILESFYKIFSNEVCESSELLVTFSDAGKAPPIVDAIHQTVIPGNGKSVAVIPHHKFNNSALYVSNREDGGMSFNPVFWDLGRANYENFFAKLKEMHDRVLQKPERVINSQMLLEKSLCDIEMQLEIALSKIDKMENFQQMVARLGPRFESCKEFEIEVEEPLFSKIACRQMTYNCQNCSLSCIKSVSAVQKKQLELVPSDQLCSSLLCPCPAAMHSVDNFEYEWRQVKTKKTLKDIKDEFDHAAGAIMSAEGVLVKIQQELMDAKQKGISLLENIATTIQLLEGSSMEPIQVLVSDYVEVSKNRIKDNRPGDSSRIDTLDELVWMMTSPKAVVVPPSRSLARKGNLMTN